MQVENLRAWLKPDFADVAVPLGRSDDAPPQAATQSTVMRARTVRISGEDLDGGSTGVLVPRA
jgi:hypothetical protein